MFQRLGLFAGAVLDVVDTEQQNISSVPETAQFLLPEDNSKLSPPFTSIFNIGSIFTTMVSSIILLLFGFFLIYIFHLSLHYYFYFFLLCHLPWSSKAVISTDLSMPCFIFLEISHITFSVIFLVNFSVNSSNILLHGLQNCCKQYLPSRMVWISIPETQTETLDAAATLLLTVPMPPLNNNTDPLSME